MTEGLNGNDRFFVGVFFAGFLSRVSPFFSRGPFRVFLAGDSFAFLFSRFFSRGLGRRFEPPAGIGGIAVFIIVGWGFNIKVRGAPALRRGRPEL